MLSLGAPMESSRAAILTRLLVGVVFVLEGIKKFLFVDRWGAGRFTKIGIWHPGLTAPFVGGVEIVCGVLLLLGLLFLLVAGAGRWSGDATLSAKDFRPLSQSRADREPDFGASTTHEKHE